MNRRNRIGVIAGFVAIGLSGCGGGSSSDPAATESAQQAVPASASAADGHAEVTLFLAGMNAKYRIL